MNFWPFQCPKITSFPRFSNFAFLTYFAIEKIGQCETIRLAHATLSPNESYHAVDQVIRATRRRPHISWSDKCNLSNETSCMMEYAEWRARCPLGKPRGIGLYQSKGPSKRPWKEETLRADWHQPTTRKLCFNIQQWKTTSCLPYKPCVGWFLDFVITSWSEFLKIFTFKVLGRGACLVSPYFGNDLNLGALPFT